MTTAADATDATELDMPLAMDVPRGCEELPLAFASRTDPSPAVDVAAANYSLFLQNICALDSSDVLNVMETSLGADDPLTAAQAIQQAQKEGLVLSESSSSTSRYTNVRQLRDDGRGSRPFRAEMRTGQRGAKCHIGCFSTPEEAALHVARARAQIAVLNDLLPCHEGPGELTAGLSGTDALVQQASVAARPAELPAELSGTASSVQQASGAAAPPVTTARVPAAAAFTTNACTTNAIAADATPVPAAPSYELATALSHPRGMHGTLHTHVSVPVSLPGPSGSKANDLLGSDALKAAYNMVDLADSRMHPRVLSFLKGKRDERVQACMEVLKHNETLVFGRSLSGYSQVRVVGPSMQGSIDSQLDEAVRSGRPLRFQAARVLPPLLPNGRRTTVHGQYYLLPELAASELAVPLTNTLPTPSAAVSSLSVEAQNALRTADAEGLILERTASVAGFCGVVCNER